MASRGNPYADKGELETQDQEDADKTVDQSADQTLLDVQEARTVARSKSISFNLPDLDDDKSQVF